MATDDESAGRSASVQPTVTWNRLGGYRMQAVRDAHAAARAWQDRILAAVEVRPGVTDPDKWRLAVDRGMIPTHDMAALLRLAARRLEEGQ